MPCKPLVIFDKIKGRFANKYTKQFDTEKLVNKYGAFIKSKLSLVELTNIYKIIRIETRTKVEEES